MKRDTIIILVCVALIASFVVSIHILDNQRNKELNEIDIQGVVHPCKEIVSEMIDIMQDYALIISLPTTSVIEEYRIKTEFKIRLDNNFETLQGPDCFDASGQPIGGWFTEDIKRQIKDTLILVQMLT